VTVTVGAAVSVSNFPATQVVAGTVTVGNTVTVAGTVTANPTGTQTVAGTVTASLADVVADDAFHGVPHVRVNGGYGQGVELAGIDINGGHVPIWEGGGIPVFPRDFSSLFHVAGTVTVGNTVTIAGTVTANPAGTQTVAGTVTVGNTVTVAGTVTANPAGTQTVAGTVTANLNPQLKGPIIEIDSPIPADPKYVAIVGGFDTNAGESRALKLGSSGEIVVGQLPAISGTVTVGNLPRGELTTRFGSVTTAGTAQLTSAVTNASRKYLLLQNISTGAVTVGVGFVPTTTQGIALAAGAGLTFDAFCPTGAVHWLGGTAGAPFTILEG
jgi:hypothetical protein